LASKQSSFCANKFFAFIGNSFRQKMCQNVALSTWVAFVLNHEYQSWQTLLGKNNLAYLFRALVTKEQRLRTLTSRENFSNIFGIKAEQPLRK
jgi:hypothetical protein